MLNLQTQLALIQAVASRTVDTVTVVDTVQVVDTLVSTDTVRFVPYDDYQKMVEQTTSVFGIWWEALGVAVAVLSVLFAVGTVMVTFVLFRQSKEYRDQADAVVRESVKEYQELLNTFIEAKNLEIRSQLDAAIAANEEALVSATGEHRQEIEAAIADIKEKREAFVAVSDVLPLGRSGPKTVAEPIGGVTLATGPRCGHCGGVKYFSGDRDPRTGQWLLRCSACGRESPSS